MKASVVCRKTRPVTSAVLYDVRRGLVLTALINKRALTHGCSARTEFPGSELAAD